MDHRRWSNCQARGSRRASSRARRIVSAATPSSAPTSTRQTSPASPSRSSAVNAPRGHATSMRNIQVLQGRKHVFQHTPGRYEAARSRTAEADHCRGTVRTQAAMTILTAERRKPAPKRASAAAAHHVVGAFATGHQRAQCLPIRQEQAPATSSPTTCSTTAATRAASPNVPSASDCSPSRSRGHPGHHPLRTASRDGWRPRQGVRFVDEETASVACGAMLTALRPGRTPPSATRDPQVLALRRVSERQVFVHRGVPRGPCEPRRTPGPATG